ncbi:MAG: tRNA pseudouridine(38-40) synthase TruA, partial [Fimbriimonadaceae bacterium]
QAGQRTVQSTLKEAVRQVSGEDCEIIGASRTDSGAHARGQVCHFDSAKPVKHWYQALNRALPLDVRVAKVELEADTFHSRFSAADRFYRYRILSDVSDPFRGRFAYVNHQVLNLDMMQEAAGYLEGEHDFRAFTEELDESVENTVRELYSVTVKRVRNEVRVDIVGTAFLRGMMRRISGGLFEVGRGKRPLEEIKMLLSDQKHNLEWPVVLPARGLTLMQVRYGRHPRDNRLPK